MTKTYNMTTYQRAWLSTQLGALSTAGLAGLSDEQQAEFYLRHDNHWL